MIPSRPRTWFVALGAFAVSVVATSGSLYYSYGMGLAPCTLCWYQRILMYPLVVVLGVAVLYPGQDHAVARFVLPLSVPGTAIAAYHSWLQTRPGIRCTFGTCSNVEFRLFGMLSIPNQSLVAFTAITLGVGWIAVRRGVLDRGRPRAKGIRARLER